MQNLILQELRKCLIESVILTNYNANDKDINRNHTNYGATTAYENMLRNFGVNVEVNVYEENGVLKIPSILITGEVIEFERSE